jgi:small acid-soluble spore protein F (minor alpha/beta-type SASP)
MLSDDFKLELAKEIGVDDIVRREGWGSVSSRDCGNLVTAAIRYAEKLYESQNGIK